MYARMDISDDECDIILTQEPVREFNQTQSTDYGSSIVEDNGLVSLECGEIANFDLCLSGMIGSSQSEACDGIEIEDISSDEELDKM